MFRGEAVVVIPAGGDAVCVVDIDDRPGERREDARRDYLVHLLTTQFLLLEPRK
jgi:putative methionine-R-sulfoxide reductase with GAF domain